MTHLLYAYGWDLTESAENCGKGSVLLFFHDCCVGNWKEAVLTSLKAVSDLDFEQVLLEL